MAELPLTRTPGDRRLYALGELGTLRLGGMFSRAALAEAGASTWRLQSRGFLRATIQAIDASGTVVGEFRANSLRRGGTLRWDGHALELRPSSMWKERYALVDGERELIGIEAKSWGKRPVRITVDDADTIDPGLLLFAAFVVRALAEAAAAAAA